jgi:hypothetical protein
MAIPIASWYEAGNPRKRLLEQHPWHRHLRHLERDVPGVSNDASTGLDELLAKCRQRVGSNN